MLRTTFILKSQSARPPCEGRDSLRAQPESKPWLVLRVDLCTLCKTEKCMLHLYRRVLYTSHCFPREHVYCEEDHGFCESPRLSVYHHSLWHVLHRPDFNALTSRPRTRQVFLPGTVVFCESLFSAVSRKLRRALNLSVFSHDHTIKLIELFVLLTRRLER